MKLAYVRLGTKEVPLLAKFYRDTNGDLIHFIAPTKEAHAEGARR